MKRVLKLKEGYQVKRMRLLSICLGVALVASGLLAISTQSNAAQKTYTLQLAGAYPSTGNTPRANATEKIKQLIEEKSNGDIQVDIYLDSQLGGDREILEGCQLGNIAMVAQTTAPQVAFMPQLAIFDIPMLFENLDIARKVLSGPFREQLNKWYDDAGLKLLLFEPIYYRETTANKAINKVDDFDGLKIRTMENKYHLAFWRGLGANPTPLNFAELYVALQQGLVDAQENPYEIIWSSKFYEVQKYLIDTHHITFILSIIMNKNTYNSMPDNYKQIINESMEEASDYLFNQAKAQNAKMLTSIRDTGVTVIEPSLELREDMKKSAEIVEKMIREDVSNDVVDSLMEASKAVQ